MSNSTERRYNFSAGPAAIPLAVLKKAQEELLCLPGAGASVMEISHRSQQFTEIIEETESNVRSLLGVPDNYRVLFLQGGGQLQFSMVPMNLLLGSEHPGAYVVTGTWGLKAEREAAKEGTTVVSWSGAEDGFRQLPKKGEIELPSSPSYVHITSNETIQGVQFQDEPEVGDVPLVSDSSSDFLSRPVDVARYGLIYACAQKNAGAPGLTVVIVREDLLERSREDLGSMLSYRLQAEAGSRLNTPPTFAIYLFLLITRWLQEKGGLEAIAERNQRKAKILYEVVDGSDFYRGHTEPAVRSAMNVTFRLPDKTLDQRFLKEAERRGLQGLKGHRSVGGVRASIYNAMTLEGAEALRHFMLGFEKRQAGS